MTEFEKMAAGLDYEKADEGIAKIGRDAKALILKINQTIDEEERFALQQQLFGSMGQSWVQTPFFCEFGKTISIGEGTFLNMNIVMLDNASITIGDKVLIGPSVQFYTPSHSLNYCSRERYDTFCYPIVVEDGVWIGGNTVINQGVTIGARSVIAANSVVNSDVPPDCLYGGAPAKFIRKLDPEGDEHTQQMIARANRASVVGEKLEAQQKAKAEQV